MEQEGRRWGNVIGASRGMRFVVLARSFSTTSVMVLTNVLPISVIRTCVLVMTLSIIALTVAESWWQKMWTIDKPYYSEKNIILMLKEASTEKLIEFLLMVTRGGKKMANEKRLIPLYKQPWWGSYKSMMARCYRKTAEHFDMYGGRGIKVCDEWFNPDAFGEWAKSSGFQKGLTLERKDVNGNYCPENCAWATPKQQANNRRNTIFLEWHGERKSIHQWADEMCVSASTLKNRYYLGWSVEEILSLPVTRRKPRRGNLSA